MDFVPYVRNEVNLLPLAVFSDACSNIYISKEIVILCMRRLVSGRPQTKLKPYYVPEYGCLFGMFRFSNGMPF